MLILYVKNPTVDIGGNGFDTSPIRSVNDESPYISSSGPTKQREDILMILLSAKLSTMKYIYLIDENRIRGRG